MSRSNVARRATLMVAIGCVAFATTASWAVSDSKPDGLSLSLGVEGLIHDLSQRERELTRREAELTVRERSIASLEAQIEERILEVESIRANVVERIEAWNETSGDQVKRLSKVYAAMPPTKSAPLLEELAPDLATAILSKMKDKVSAAILAKMPQPVALRLSNRLARPLDAPINPKEAGSQ